MNIAQLLAASARGFPERPAMSVGTAPVFDYRTLGARAAALAGALARHARPGDRVAIASANCLEYVEILYGCWWAGLVVAPLNARLAVPELAYIVADCDARLIFADESLAHGLAAAFPDRPVIVPGSADYDRLVAGDDAPLTTRQQGDPAWIFYTSGTTGKPKGAMLSHGNLMAMTLIYLADVDFLSERDALLHLAATSHASGLFGLSFVAKAANNILPESGGFDPAELALLIDATPELTFFAPPTLLRRMGQYPALAAANMANVKTVLVGAAPVSVGDITLGVALFGPKIWNGYGQGETPCTISAMSKSMIADALAQGREDRLNSVGIARTGITVAIVDDAGRPLPDGAVGEVAVHGPTVMSGYLGNPEATTQALRDGWLLTGDLGRLDDCGYLTLLDRKKDLIISGGMNIYAREIEDILLRDPTVLEAAVIGLPDPEWGESVVALIVPAPGAAVDPATLDQLCLDHAARFKRPKRYEIAPELPKNSSGKVLKRELRERFAQA